MKALFISSRDSKNFKLKTFLVAVGSFYENQTLIYALTNTLFRIMTTEI